MLARQNDCTFSSSSLFCASTASFSRRQLAKPVAARDGELRRRERELVGDGPDLAEGVVVVRLGRAQQLFRLVAQLAEIGTRRECRHAISSAGPRSAFQ